MSVYGTFLWVSNPLEWLFLCWFAKTYRNPPPLPGLGTGYVETTQESLLVNTGRVFNPQQYRDKISQFQKEEKLKGNLFVN